MSRSSEELSKEATQPEWSEKSNRTPRSPVNLRSSERKKQQTQQGLSDNTATLAAKKHENSLAKETLKPLVDIPPIAFVEQAKNKQNEMDTNTIYSLIKDFVPDFDGDSNKLPKFLAGADFVYNKLTNDREKEDFTKLIIFKLDGDVFTKIQKQQIRNFEMLKAILNNAYSIAYSLEELYQNYRTCTQRFQEPIRRYGLRITEAMSEYKTGYRAKYGTEVDQSHGRHLEEQGIQTFKRGLNNLILREKIATIKANSLLDIINETEEIEKMLAAATEVSYQPQQGYPQYRPFPSERQTINCYYCNKPGHTRNNCQTRINHQNHDQRRPMNYFKSFSAQPTMNNYTGIQQAQRHNNGQMPRFPQMPTDQQFTPRKRDSFCTYCKRPGHMILECRSRMKTNFSPNRTQNQNQTGTENLTSRFNEMKILNINQHIEEPVVRYQPQEQSLNSQGLELPLESDCPRV